MYVYFWQIMQYTDIVIPKGDLNGRYINSATLIDFSMKDTHINI